MSSSAKRALKILTALGESGRPMGVTEIARGLGVAPGTAFRGLDALERAHLIARHPSAPRHVLGATALALRQGLIAQFRIRDVALPYLRQLASAMGETCSLHVRIGWYAARIATAPGAAEVTSAVPKGIEPLALGFAGRAILAFLDRNHAAKHRAWAGLRGLTLAGTFEDELAAIRESGFSRRSGPESAVAFPIRFRDQAFASIAVEGSSFADSAGEKGRFPAAAQIARAIEAVVRASPTSAHQPFDHIDPDELRLPS